MRRMGVYGQSGAETQVGFFERGDVFGLRVVGVGIGHERVGRGQVDFQVRVEEGEDKSGELLGGRAKGGEGVA